MQRAAGAWRQIRRIMLGAVLACVALPAPGAGAPSPTIIVFAASSLTDAVNALVKGFGKSTGIAVKASYAASSALARQIASGAPADVFLSADVEWMDYLQRLGMIRAGTRRDLVGNSLVLIAPVDSRVRLAIGAHFPLAAALGTGRLATGDPDAVPVGRYARAALTSLGIWPQLADRLVRADNVRVALALVARGEAPLGIVYRTDALLEPKVRIVGEFPATSHPAIRYPVALTAAAQPNAVEFLDYLRSAAGEAVFKRYGFTPLH